ncbi:MAG: T9SS type A sorting domain-containing protein [Flavobacterium sp.]|uniref:T9SS type A sorting domain-containing protein n=1 Tax=Flavobacterium sp. TaxID=239 RepID=UPI00121BE3C3|nr:T9SS type A sorting domain-containing protein [Flavobacterium sp.]RZJ65500.1 MAG: T9SS type A sorting domain-containing protein [Flavobacterium sp.]
MNKTTLGLIAFLFFGTTLTAQSVSGYTFSQSVETYSAVTGSTSTATGDDGTQDDIPFGFSFPFGGTGYSTFSISTNGFIRLGNPVAATNWVNTLATTAAQRPLIAPFWDDHNAASGVISFAFSGSYPNRVAEIGWNNINPSGGGATSATAFGSFKIRLHETSGVIEFIYGPTINAVNTFSASIGLNDDTTFLSVTPAATATVSSATANNNITASNDVVGKKYTFTPQPQCSGVPTPGNSITSDASVCANVEFTLSLQTPGNSYGILYQWQSSDNGTTFANISNANGPTLTTTQISDTFYRCVVSCGASSANSEPVLVSNNSLADCYCAPTYTQGMTDGDLISNVTITGTTLSNNTGTEPVNPYYTFFSGQPNYTAELVVGGSYQLNVTVGTYGAQHSTAWIDYNDDTVFAEEERIGFSEGEIGSLETAVYTIVLSCDASPGTHRLRIRNVWNTDSWTIDPCANYGYGETEDYDVTILGGETCQSPFNLAVTGVNASSGIFTWSSGCAQTSWNVYLVESSDGSEPTAPTFTDVSSPFTFTGLNPETPYYIYVQANCGADGFSDWSGPFAFTTMEQTIANDDCNTAFTVQVGGVFDDYAITATNMGATKTLGEPNVTCAAFGFGGDVWFSATVPASGTLSFETRADSTSALDDTGMAAYTGSCGGGLTALGCSDDEGVDGFSVLHLAGLTPGATVFARVWEYANDNPGTFRFAAYDSSLGTSTFASNQIKLYPNPVKNVLTISSEETIIEASIINLLGQTLLSETPNVNSAEIDLSSLPSGNYFVKVTAGANSKTVKIIKE